MSPLPSAHQDSVDASAIAAPLTLTLPAALLQTIAEQAAAIAYAQLATTQASSPYLTIPEAAAYLRCKRQRIDDLLSARKLSRHKDGRRTLLLRAEIEALPKPTTGPHAVARRATG